MPTSETLIEEADEFLHACYTELNRITELPERRRAVAPAIEADGTHDHTFAELEYGVRVAWRNSSRCIGRLYWRTLRLRDRRADADRYDLLPTVAANLGLDTGSDRTLWRDRALVELNLAVLHSYEQAGVTIADHHTESHRFLTHLDKEARAGRGCPAEWSWIVPPLSSGSTAVFHRYYEQVDVRPNFVRH
ncbi:MAG: nitric oxide synthase oxygenase [Catenulisporales bacterium]|nr:nitric oxide synthase oxygenase [Catenulisporales bacterium]